MRLLGVVLGACNWIPLGDLRGESAVSGRCGDGEVGESEECDEGAANSDEGACTTACLEAECGDGHVWEGVETCEDDNSTNHDGCSTKCLAPRSLELASVGIELVGEAEGDGVPDSMSIAGDIDDDGVDDLVLGASENDRGGEDVGAVYVIYGPVDTLDLANADAILVGDENDSAGRSVSSGGDVDGDGKDDVLVGGGAWAYLLYGPIYGTLDLTEADARLRQQENSIYVRSVSLAGDVDGDDSNDLVVGVPAYGAPATLGAAFLIYGPVYGDIDLADSDAKLVGEVDAGIAGDLVSSGGDVDGDGLDDILIGAPQDTESSAAAVYIVHGPVSGTLGLGDADAKLTGEFLDAQIAGDLDRDGLDDILVGGFFTPSRVVYMPVQGTFILDSAETQLAGETPIDSAGLSLSVAGDVDGDGFLDLLIGAPGHSTGGIGTGAAYLLYGPVQGMVSLAHSDIKFVGAAEDFSGLPVSGGGDVDGDGLDDILIGASGRDFGGTDAGSAYLVYGASL
jgi:cysteine-rich repeat protein